MQRRKQALSLFCARFLPPFSWKYDLLIPPKFNMSLKFLKTLLSKVFGLNSFKKVKRVMFPAAAARLQEL